MPFYHALLKNTQSSANASDPMYRTDGAEYSGLFTEEMIAEKFPKKNMKLIVVNFFDTETDLIAFHNSGEWKTRME